MEQAFLKALDANPKSRLVPRLRKAIRHSHKDRRTEEGLCDRELQQLRYRWQQLGRRWASFRLGGCSWVGPIQGLRDDWQELWQEVDARGARELSADLLGEIVVGIGLDKDALEWRGRDYLMRVLEARAGAAAWLCRLDGIRWLSPLTVFVEAVSDLAGHDYQHVEALHAFLAERLLSDPEVNATLQMPELRRAVAAWLASSANGNDGGAASDLRTQRPTPSLPQLAAPWPPVGAG